MYCSRCHTPNFRADRYCRHCGGQLPAAGPVAPVDEEVEEHLRKALALLDQGDASDALAATQAALALEPGSPFGHSVLAHVYERQGRIPEAIQQLQIVLRVNPQSTADREKLAALTGGPSPAPAVAARAGRTRPLVLAVAAGCVVILLGGVYAGMLARQRDDAAQNRAQDSTKESTQPLPTSSTAAGAPVTKAIVGPPLPSGFGQSAASGPIVSGSATQAQYPAAPVNSGSPVQQTGRIGLPPVYNQVRANGGSAGLSPAVIGEISPLTPEPQPAVQPESDSGSPALTPEVVNGGTPEPRPAEPIETDSGFIKVERTKPRVEAPAAPRKPGPPPSISVTFGEGGTESLLLEAQREEGRAEEAARTGNQSDAARRYRNAQRMYENIARRGGAEAQAARSGAENCRKALTALSGG